MPQKSRKFLTFVILIILLFGCRGEISVTSSSIPTLSIRASSTQKITKIVTTPSITKTPEPSFTHVPSQTSSPSVPAIKTSVPSKPPTFGPTLSPEKLEEMIQGLLKTNGGCKLPCLWGFTPGKTPWSDIDNFYRSIGIAPLPYKDTYSIEIRFKSQMLTFGEEFSVKDNIVQAIRVGASMVRNNRLVYGDVYYYQMFLYFYPQVIFKEYGLPEEILVWIYPGALEDGNTPFSVLINYNSNGFSLIYEGDVEKTGTKYIICPRWSNVDAFLWSTELSDQNTVRQFWDDTFISPEYLKEYKTLEEASGMSIETFYQESLVRQACIYTESDIWSP